MKLVFLQNSATQPRCHKRYRAFRQLGIEGIVYSFDRNWYSVNIPEDIKMNIIGTLAPGSYIHRLKYYITKLRPIFKEHKGDSIFYCYGQDMAFVAYIYGVKYIYEESDLMYLEYKNSFARWVMKKIDLFLQKKSRATILTSTGFVDYLYKKQPQNVFVLPNKLDPYFHAIKRPEIKIGDINHLRFAFIGLLRYPETLFPFIKIILNFNSKYEFHIWGDGPQEMKDQIAEMESSCDRLIYHGPFRNPIDLEDIYSKIDINFVCYDNHGLNEQIAEPNKLYESAFFNKPILVSPNTYLSKVVNRLGIGYVVNCYSLDDIQGFIKNLSETDLNVCKQNCMKLSVDDIIDNCQELKEVVKFLD